MWWFGRFRARPRSAAVCPRSGSGFPRLLRALSTGRGGVVHRVPTRTCVRFGRGAAARPGTGWNMAAASCGVRSCRRGWCRYPDPGGGDPDPGPRLRQMSSRGNVRRRRVRDPSRSRRYRTGRRRARAWPQFDPTDPSHFGPFVSAERSEGDTSGGVATQAAGRSARALGPDAGTPTRNPDSANCHLAGTFGATGTRFGGFLGSCCRARAWPQLDSIEAPTSGPS